MLFITTFTTSILSEGLDAGKSIGGIVVGAGGGEAASVRECDKRQNK